MTGEPAIAFGAVWKGFRRHTGRLLLRSHVSNLVRTRSNAETLWAVKDLSFEMQHGESVAVVGANGAGKSTLLSLVAGLVEPDAGEVAIHGRVAALLQLGSGFHPDLTGAENVRLNAALLGIHRKGLRDAYADIVEFAGMGEFMNEPLRTYSAGMTMRLAFSVAIHVEPDILLVDELLAVGDHAFRRKCAERILEFRRKGGTILCVSHDSATILQLCTRALWLDHGELVRDGPVAEVCEAYEGQRSIRR